MCSRNRCRYRSGIRKSARFRPSTSSRPEAGQLLGRRVELDDAAAGVEGHDGDGRARDQRPGQRLPLGQLGQVVGVPDLGRHDGRPPRARWSGPPRPSSPRPRSGPARTGTGRRPAPSRPAARWPPGRRRHSAGFEGQLDRSRLAGPGQRAEPGQQRGIGGVRRVRRQHRGGLSRGRLEGQRGAQAERAPPAVPAPRAARPARCRPAGSAPRRSRGPRPLTRRGAPGSGPGPGRP